MKFPGPRAAGPGIFNVGETRARTPGKIVHVFRVERKRLRAVGIVRRCDRIAARADDFILRKRPLYIERPEIREKFRRVVKLMAIPSALPPDANLGKPLADHVEITEISSSREDFGHLVVESDLEFHFGARRDSSRKFD